MAVVYFVCDTCRFLILCFWLCLWIAFRPIKLSSALSPFLWMHLLLTAIPDETVDLMNHSVLWHPAMTHPAQIWRNCHLTGRTEPHLHYHHPLLLLILPALAVSWWHLRTTNLLTLLETTSFG